MGRRASFYGPRDTILEQSERPAAPRARGGTPPGGANAEKGVHMQGPEREREEQKKRCCGPTGGPGGRTYYDLTI